MILIDADDDDMKQFLAVDQQLHEQLN